MAFWVHELLLRQSKRTAMRTIQRKLMEKEIKFIGNIEEKVNGEIQFHLHWLSI